jgi:MFS transporter, MHS family, proline/betaine transporter
MYILTQKLPYWIPNNHHSVGKLSILTCYIKCFFLVRYDFAVYGLLAPEIGAVFFPAVSKELQLINSFGVYLAAFLMRPLGAVLFGEIGDRMVGRKNALVFSIILITIPSILMGCLPTYYDWGWIAPVLLVILRLFQGLSVGGQLAGSYVLSIEQSSQRTRGMRGSICDASSVCCFCSCWLSRSRSSSFWPDSF